jgi:signal transduction histidine kinase/DNA-binding response OmpR family regulator/ligand-binding sensor domain-containing protein
MFTKVSWWIVLLIFVFQFCNTLSAQEQLFPYLDLQYPLKIGARLRQDVRGPVVRDQTGYVWFGGPQGLVRYDGYESKTYRHNPDDPHSLTSTSITSLFLDSRNWLWVGSFPTGLSLYDASQDHFNNILARSGDSSWYQGQGISTILEDHASNIWLATSSLSIGVVCIEMPAVSRSTDIDSLTDLVRFNTYSIGKSLISINGMVMKDDGRIFIASDSGLIILDHFSHTFLRSQFSDSLGQRLNSQVINCIHHGSHGNLWLGTRTEGLFCVESLSNKVLNFRHKEGDNKTIKSDNIDCITEDWQGNLWISTDEGLCLFSPAAGRCTPFAFYDSWLLDASCNISVDRMGMIWVTTGQNSVYCRSSKSPLFTHFTSQTSEGLPQVYETIEKDQHGKLWFSRWGQVVLLDILTKKVLKTIEVNKKWPGQSTLNNNNTMLDDQGNFWYGSGGQGLYKINLSTGQVKNYRFQSRFSKECIIQSIIKGSGNIFWIEGLQNGLMKFNSNSENFLQVLGKSELGTTWDLMKDKNGQIWIATNENGIVVYDPGTRTTSKFLNNPADPHSLSHNTVQEVYQDHLDRIWVGAANVINLYDSATKTFTRYTNPQFENTRWAIPKGADKSGRLWITYDNEFLSMLDPASGIFTNYYFSDGGIWGVHDMENLPDGRIIFSGSGGITIFNPDSIDTHRAAPPLVITRMSINNESVVPPAASKGLKLSYMQNVLEFEYAAIDIDAPDLVQYQHQLEGLEKDWVTPQNPRYVRYTNLEPGDYVFRVKATSIRNDWPEQDITVAINITPPWWRTTWAYTAYVLLFIGLLYTGYRLRLIQAQLKQQMEMKDFQTTHLAEVDRLKSRFFANISHEFRTPLTLILGPLEKIRSKIIDKEIQRSLSMMKRNAHQLLRLINQLLDLSKLEAGAMKLQVRLGNIIPVIKGVAYSFESSAGLRKIELKVKIEQDKIEMYFDRDKVEKILTNLLANAFKFTPDGGRVDVNVHCRGTLQHAPTTEMFPSVIITVTDNGVGIPADKLSHIFDRFYQVDDSSTRQQDGTGIGLALIKELVEMHHGTISVDSKPGVGTEFTVSLPGNRESYNPEEIIEGKLEEEPISMIEEEMVERTTTPPESESVAEQETGKAIVLVVEDNFDVRQYIRENLPESYQVMEASDGSAGIEKARETIPDLIISDVMMPKQDGYELCQVLKNDEKTSHIPIILLTAKATSENKIEGLQTGADDYLIKPFEPKELVARVDNLIELRKKLRGRFATSVPLKLGEITVTSMDDAFLKKILAAVEEHLDEEEFHIDELSNSIGMSRTQLHRKLTALTNMSPGEFIRYIRLLRAMELLQKDTGTVSEIAYQVGFHDPSYFSKCFHKQFGKSPMEVKKSAEK